jgi:Na+/proline symporter
MVFAYAGLLGVYFTAIFTKRGTSNSVVLALIVGFLTVLLLQPGIAQALAMPQALHALAFPYQLCIGTLIAFLICAVPAGKARPEITA